MPGKLVYYRYLVKEIRIHHPDLSKDSELYEFLQQCNEEVAYNESCLPIYERTQAIPTADAGSPRDLRFYEKPVRRLQWMKSTRALMYFMKQLHESGCISTSDYNDRYDLVSSHFIDRNGDELTKKDLQAAETQQKDNKTRAHEGKPRDAHVYQGIVRSVGE